MLNYIWGALMLISIVSACALGRIDELNSAVFSGAQNAVKLVISLCGVICFWSGLMKVAEKVGITKLISKILAPLLKLIFGNVDEKSKQAISMNITANLLGIGNAATPFGLEAMKRLKSKSKLNDTASDKMIIFVVINTAAFQLVPTNIIAMRMSLGASSPSSIIPCVWLCSLISLFVGIGLAKLLNRVKSYE